jgi:hypothetical protein
MTRTSALLVVATLAGCAQVPTPSLPAPDTAKSVVAPLPPPAVAADAQAKQREARLRELADEMRVLDERFRLVRGGGETYRCVFYFDPDQRPESEMPWARQSR